MSEKKRPVETVAEWLRCAGENMRVVQRELTNEDPAYHTVCFLWQSAAEKYLKAYLIAQGWKLEKTHDIVVLLGYCSDYDPAFGKFKADGAILNEYVVAGRYPGDVSFEAISQVEAEEAAEISKQIAELVTARLKEQPG